MKIITVKVENEHDAELLKKVIQEAPFENKIETFEEEEISDEEFSMLEERWVKYEQNPSSGISLDDFKKEMKNKHGL